MSRHHSKRRTARGWAKPLEYQARAGGQEKTSPGMPSGEHEKLPIAANNSLFLSGVCRGFRSLARAFEKFRAELEIVFLRAPFFGFGGIDDIEVRGGIMPRTDDRRVVLAIDAL